MSPNKRRQHLQRELDLAIEHISHLMSVHSALFPVSAMIEAKASARSAIESYATSALGQLAGCVGASAGCDYCSLPSSDSCELHSRLWHAEHAALTAKHAMDDINEVRAYIASLEEELARLSRAGVDNGK